MSEVDFTPARQFDKIASALSKAQAQFKPVEKSGFNPYFNSHYSTLLDIKNATKEALAANGLAISHLPLSQNGLSGVNTLLFHSSGQYLEATLLLRPKEDTLQGAGGAISYAKRYNENAILGLADEDDDGQHATHGQTQTQTQTTTTTQTTGTYVINFGKYNGKTFDQLTGSEIASYVKYLKEAPAKDKNAKAFIQNAENYLSANSELSEPLPPLPPFNPLDENIPF